MSLINHMAKQSENWVEQLQQLSKDDLIAWLGNNDITESTLGALLGKSQRQLSHYTNGHQPVPAYLGLILNMIEMMPTRNKDKLLRELKQLSGQPRHSHRRPKE